MAPVRKGSQWENPKKDETALLPTGDREMTYKKSTGEVTGERNSKRTDTIKAIVEKKKDDTVATPLREQIKKSISKK